MNQITYDAMNKLTNQMNAYNIDENFDDLDEVSTPGFIALTQHANLNTPQPTNQIALFNHVPAHNTVNTVVNPPYSVVQCTLTDLFFCCSPNSFIANHGTPAYNQLQNTTVNYSTVVNPPYSGVLTTRALLEALVTCLILTI